jgi:hypothetical protein
MAKVKTIKDSNEDYFNRDSIFNSKLFLNIDINNEQYLNNSYIKDPDNSGEIEDINTGLFLTKELIEELNSSKTDISLNKSSIEDKDINNINDELYYLINNRLFDGNGNESFNKYNFKNYVENKNRITHKKYKFPREKKEDWVCPLCHNLNYSFRTICNRCKIPKKEVYFFSK